MSASEIAETIKKIEDTLSRLPASSSFRRNYSFPWVNYYIRLGCIGISGAVFVAWQYGLRDDSSPLADPDIWRKVDPYLGYGTFRRVRRYLEDNFTLKWDDPRLRPWTLITSGFSHIRPGHLIGNLLALDAFSNILQFNLPPIHFVGLIISTGLLSSTAFLTQLSRRSPRNRRVRALGMSGITTGIGVATAVFQPNAMASVYGFPVPIWVALGGYAAWDAFFLDSNTSTIGHSAHLGGGLAGLLYALSLKLMGGTFYQPVPFTSRHLRK